MTDETTRPCWCTSAEGLLVACVPYLVRSFNADLDATRQLFADQGIIDVGLALVAFHDGEIVAEAERECARRIAAGVTAPADVDKLIVESGAIIVARALLLVRELIQRLTRASDSADAPAC